MGWEIIVIVAVWILFGLVRSQLDPRQRRPAQPQMRADVLTDSKTETPPPPVRDRLRERRRPVLPDMQSSLATTVEPDQEPTSEPTLDLDVADDFDVMRTLESTSQWTVPDATSMNGSQSENRLTPDRLIDGVILSEVLGPPRVLKPYRPQR